MAAIDKIYVTEYYDFEVFRNWVFAYCPTLIFNMYAPFLSHTEYNKWSAASKNGGRIPIANFTRKQDLTLLWRCPIDFIRVYLEKQCGFKTRWYHKLFWKGKSHIL